MEYLELGEIFKININNKTVYLKVEPDGSKQYCNGCYFNQKGNNCPKESNCSDIDRNDDTSVIYKQINPIQIVYIVFVKKLDKSIKRIGIYPTEEDAKKKVEELNRDYFNFVHYYEAEEYYPYGIITDIKEVKIN